MVSANWFDDTKKVRSGTVGREHFGGIAVSKGYRGQNRLPSADPI